MDDLIGADDGGVNMDSLLPEIPLEIRAARIGTCYDSVKRMLKYDTIVFDINRLPKGAVIMVDGKASLKLRADSSVSKNAQDTFFSVDSSAKFGSWVSAGYSMESSNSGAETNKTLNCYCSYVYSGQRLVLQNLDSDTLFSYMRDDFQKALTELADETNPASFLLKYINFQQTFGYGCVTELLLTSGSAFQMSAKYSDSQTANKAKYKADVAIGSPWGGASVASSFAKQVQTADNKASLVLSSEFMPQNTPTKGWCESLANTLLAKGLQYLANDSSMISAYSGDAPKAPKIPEGTPSKKDPPKESKLDISDELKKELMKNDGFDGKWEDYVKAQKKAYEKINPEAVALEVCENYDRLLAMNLEQDITPPSSAEPDKAEEWDLGGYIPYDYVVKPWTELFKKQLKGLSLPTTFTSIYIAKAYIYYLTRMQFASYINFLSDVGGKHVGNDSIEIDAKRFTGECNILLNNIQKAIENALKKDKAAFTESDYNKVVAAFEQNISKLSDFNSLNIYLYFYYNYRFFIDMACGCVIVSSYKGKNGWYYYTSSIDDKPVPKPFSVPTMLKDASRVYQALTPKIELKSMLFYRDRFYQSLNIIYGLGAERKIDENGCAYYNSTVPKTGESVFEGLDISQNDVITEVRMYIAGYSELNALKGFSIPGRPMISPFDFESILKFANPDTPLMGCSL